jgi:hypothetical protein
LIAETENRMPATGLSESGTNACVDTVHPLAARRILKIQLVFCDLVTMVDYRRAIELAVEVGLRHAH